MKVMIVVTHLLGTGHLARASTLARAFTTRGHDASLVSGGLPVARFINGPFQTLQLPPVCSDGVNFTGLLDDSGDVASAEHFAARQKMLISTLEGRAPDVLITELFPFGRRVLRDEFRALLQAAHALPNRPLVCSSVRDILAPPSTPSKAEATKELVLQHYDAVFVHSDPTLTPLDASWPVTPPVAQKLRYTGYVAPPPASPHPNNNFGAGEIIVSAGGADVGRPVFKAALEAAGAMPEYRWRLLVGGADAITISTQLRRNAPVNTVIEPARADFRQMLHHAAASVSLCGYNTALDLLQTHTPAVFIPFDAGGETEQTVRANTLSKLDGIEVLANAELSSNTLVSALRRVMVAPLRNRRIQGFDGADKTVDFAQELREAML